MVITVVGLGYVGLSLACLLSQHNTVYAVDIDEQRIKLINSGISPIKDDEIENYLGANIGLISANVNGEEYYASSDFVIIATPTNYDDVNGSFDTSSIEAVLSEVLSINPDAAIVIKSTVPVGYTTSLTALYPDCNILFSPEFLREGHALYDNLNPSRIVVGITDDKQKPAAEAFSGLLCEGADSQSIPVMITGTTEAEAIKLFANTYLALRVSYFNELDTYAAIKGLNAKQIIEGVCLDPRIGNQYNNPSFGYGGYCLPKDSKQLLANYKGVPQNIIKAVVDSNETRKSFIADQILHLAPSVVGVYRLAMKTGSDNFRQSSIIDVIAKLSKKGVSLLIYEPRIDSDDILGISIENNLEVFKSRCDIILANRVSPELSDVTDKLYTRDLWNRD